MTQRRAADSIKIIRQGEADKVSFDLEMEQFEVSDTMTALAA